MHTSTSTTVYPGQTPSSRSVVETEEWGSVGSRFEAGFTFPGPEYLKSTTSPKTDLRLQVEQHLLIGQTAWDLSLSLYFPSVI
jgi:hypothetical protein